MKFHDERAGVLLGPPAHARTHVHMHALISGIIGRCDGVDGMEENP
jgi:hypothetical protein